MKRTAQQLEALLFVSSRPLSVKRLATLLSVSAADVQALIAELSEKWNQEDSGIRLIENNGNVQLMSAPEHAELVAGFLKDETRGELTRPALETLSIIAYRQPVTKPELEQIRGVNCSLILRNLLVRGLILEKEDSTKMAPVYAVSMDFVRLLGLESVQQLPNFAQLSTHEYFDEVLNDMQS